VGWVGPGDTKVRPAGNVKKYANELKLNITLK